ncbi:hypothetical protein SUDANB51_06026 [Streptomyces sp. enrichment culture]|uniref:hypothetical protein n=1 Tax=Streptomyces sp. SudanB52_2052 TaxID=3035276 RepID=UPI003F55171E
MCRIDVAAKEAAVARFLEEFPRAPRAGRAHPALRGCEDIAWAEFPGCPAGIRPCCAHCSIRPRLRRPSGCSATS